MPLLLLSPLLLPGTYDITVTNPNGKNDTMLNTFVVTPAVSTEPNISVSKVSQDFGEIFIGNTSAETSFIVSNTGEASDTNGDGKIGIRDILYIMKKILNL